MSSLLLSMFRLWDASPQSSLESRSLTAGSKGALISSQSITRSQPLSHVDQLNRILHHLGTPPEDTLRSVGPPRAQEYTRSLPIKPRTPVPHANPLAIDLLPRTLNLDPAKRTTCEEALNYPYLQVWHDPWTNQFVRPSSTSASKTRTRSKGGKS